MKAHLRGVGQHRSLASVGLERRAPFNIRCFRNSQKSCYALLKDADGRNPLAGADELPLLGKRIIVTAPRQYSQKLCAKLVNSGARPLVVPAVQITELPPEHRAQMLEELHRLLLRPHSSTSTATTAASTASPATPTPATTSSHSSHSSHHSTRCEPAISHIAFTSRNGIFAFMQALGAALGGIPAAVGWLGGSGIRLCALGADGEVLRELGLIVHVAPQEASTQGLVRELVQRGEAAGARVLCPVPLVAGGLVEPPVVPRFLQALQDAGATPLRLSAYLTSPACSPQQCITELGALRAGQVAAIAFSSTAEAQGLVQLVGGTAALAEIVRQHGVVLAAHGPYTAAGVRESTGGLEVGVVSRNFASFDGLVAALEEHFSR
ncbi:hypothetical protein Agub_g10728 [Astrephomene gubernaculifera]|uniref:Tetrapyrrole biosynthesis uroporphyrinogen III synthase domain-containing protein n=1 Tax=Astrephomene gubernaculifera TaxID=47775 RepID=A0AAD3DVC9_9CHLO|nr:hypothetical protein Agub_g10728 [Astrephomene gubernaculifera]